MRRPKNWRKSNPYWVERDRSLSSKIDADLGMRKLRDGLSALEHMANILISRGEIKRKNRTPRASKKRGK